MARRAITRGMRMSAAPALGGTAASSADVEAGGAMRMAIEPVVRIGELQEELRAESRMGFYRWIVHGRAHLSLLSALLYTPPTLD